MEHLRNRYAEKYVKNGLQFSAIVGLLGMRQVGKTTLVEGLLGESYRTFDDEDQLSAATSAPQEYLAQFNEPVALDECQKVPGLFPALKLRVQRSKRPGQFLLTGSVRFTSRKAIRESLTGRIHNIEVLPLTISEMHRKSPNDFSSWSRGTVNDLQKIMNSRLEWFSKSQISTFMNHGGLPGICFLRKSAHRTAAFKSLLETLLQRDLRLVIETTVPFTRVLSLLRFAAKRQGTPFVVREASRATGVSAPTIDKLMVGFEALFLVRRFSGSGDRSGDTFYFEDQGLAKYLAAESESPVEQNFAFSQLFAAAHYAHMNEMTMTYFETKGGARVPFVFELPRQTVGFIFNPSEAITVSTVKVIRAFQERFPKAEIFLLSDSTQVAQIFDKVWRIPLLGVV